jgi:hypothetical protein
MPTLVMYQQIKTCGTVLTSGILPIPVRHQLKILGNIPEKKETRIGWALEKPDRTLNIVGQVGPVKVKNPSPISFA